MSDFQSKQYVTSSATRQYTSGVKDGVRSTTQDRVEQVITRETPKVTSTRTEVEQRSITQVPRMQSQQILRTQTQGFVGGQSYVSNMAAVPQGYAGQYAVQQNCVASQALCMNVIVVSKEEIEAPWRLECEYLQSLLAELEKKKEVQIVEKVVEKERIVTDNSQIELLQGRINQLTNENNSLRSELQSVRGDLNLRSTQAGDLQAREQEFYSLRIRLESQISDLEDQIRKLQAENAQLLQKISQYETQIAMLSSEINRLNQKIQMKDQEIEDWKIRYSQLEEQGSTVISEKVTYLSSEVEVWKQKFIKVNHDYNECQEALTMCQAELEALKKGQQKEVVVTSSRTVTRSGATTSSVSGGVTRSSGVRQQYQQQP